jgi:hypothetical protein
VLLAARAEEGVEMGLEGKHHVNLDKPCPHLTDGGDAIASSFSETFKVFREAVTGDARLASEIIELIDREKAENQILNLAYQNGFTPKKLLLNLENFIPPSIPTLQGLVNQCVPYFLSLTNPTIKYAEWLISCLDEMSDSQQAQAVSLLLTFPNSISLAEKLTIIVKWVQENYGWRSHSSRWHLLSDEGKDALRKWVGSVNYKDFERLTNQILSRIPVTDEWQRNQLERRQHFWANYSDRFERLRILLPESSVRSLGSRNFPEDDILLYDGCEPTEICIFDFGKWFVVEFFRGAGSKVRLFKRDDFPNPDRLFTESNLSVHRLRFLGGDRHDHAYIWQGYCERWLYKHGIYPNEGTTEFKGLHSAYSRYNLSSGLPEPSSRKKQEREQKLRKWEIEIKRLEQEARKYCIQQGWL